MEDNGSVKVVKIKCCKCKKYLEPECFTKKKEKKRGRSYKCKYCIYNTDTLCFIPTCRSPRQIAPNGLCIECNNKFGVAYCHGCNTVYTIETNFKKVEGYKKGNYCLQCRP